MKDNRHLLPLSLIRLQHSLSWAESTSKEAKNLFPIGGCFNFPHYLFLIQLNSPFLRLLPYSTSWLANIMAIIILLSPLLHAAAAPRLVVFDCNCCNFRGFIKIHSNETSCQFDWVPRTLRFDSIINADVMIKHTPVVTSLFLRRLTTNDRPYLSSVSR